MKVLIVCSELAGVTSYTGGIGRGFAALAANLASRGVDTQVLLCTSEQVQRNFRGQTPEGVATHIISVRHKRPGVRLTVSALKVRRWVTRNASDRVLLAHEWLGLCSMVTSKASGRLVTNLTTSAAMIDRVEERTRPLQNFERLQRWLEKLQVQRSVSVVACSQAIASLSTEIWPKMLRRTVDVVPNGIDVESVRNIVAERLPIEPSGSDEVLLFVGRLENRKGFDVFIEALVKLLPKYPELRVKVLGREGVRPSGETASSWAASRLGDLSSRVSFMGDRPAEEVYIEMARSVVSVTPSRWEAFGNVGLEVFAAGGSVLVCTSGSGFDEYCRDLANCAQSPPGNVQALVDICGDLLDRPDQRSKLVSAASTDVNEYDVSRVADLWLSLLARTNATC